MSNNKVEIMIDKISNVTPTNADDAEEFKSKSSSKGTKKDLKVSVSPSFEQNIVSQV